MLGNLFKGNRVISYKLFVIRLVFSDQLFDRIFKITSLNHHIINEAIS